MHRGSRVAPALFGVFGYLLIKIRREAASLILGFIQGPMREENLPVSDRIAWQLVGLPGATDLRQLPGAERGVLAAGVVPSIRKRREKAFRET